MFIIEKDKNEIYSLPAKEIKFNNLKNFGTELAQKILKAIANEAKYPADIAKELKVHEQKVYYHIRNLEKAGIIKVEKKETKQLPSPKREAIVNTELVEELLERN